MVCLSICIAQMAAHTGLLDNCDVGATTLLGSWAKKETGSVIICWGAGMVIFSDF